MITEINGKLITFQTWGRFGLVRFLKNQNRSNVRFSPSEIDGPEVTTPIDSPHGLHILYLPEMSFFDLFSTASSKFSAAIYGNRLRRECLFATPKLWGLSDYSPVADGISTRPQKPYSWPKLRRFAYNAAWQGNHAGECTIKINREKAHWQLDPHDEMQPLAPSNLAGRMSPTTQSIWLKRRWSPQVFLFCLDRI